MGEGRVWYLCCLTRQALVVVVTVRKVLPLLVVVLLLRLGLAVAGHRPWCQAAGNTCCALGGGRR